MRGGALWTMCRPTPSGLRPATLSQERVFVTFFLGLLGHRLFHSFGLGGGLDVDLVAAAEAGGQAGVLALLADGQTS